MVKISDDAQGTYKTNSQIEFKTTMFKSSVCDYTDACILVKGTIAITGAETAADKATRQEDKRNKQVIFRSCAAFTNSICKTNNTQIDNAKDMDIVM